MRKTLSCFARTQASHESRLVRQYHLHRSRPLRVVPTFDQPRFCLHKLRVQHVSPSLSRVPSFSTSAPRHARPKAEQPKKPEALDLKDPAAWVKLFDEYLPEPIRSRKVKGGRTFAKKVTASKIFSILKAAEANTKVKLWSWMVRNGRVKAVVWLLNGIVKDVATRTKSAPEDLTSNIDWPTSIFKDVKYAITCPQVNTYTAINGRAAMLDLDTASTVAAQPEDHSHMNAVWHALAQMTIAAASASEELNQAYMSAVHLVLGTLHKEEMVPPDLYTYKTLNHSSYVRRPPILHLVSSRILTALSDAVWREEQDEAIAKAADLGMKYKDISKNVPGGRFRLKVRPLPPEIWLELILWCCIDGNYRAAALAAIETLRQQDDQPWFAIRWCSPLQDATHTALVDWDRMKLRHGGTVGLIEGYSREKPFVDVPEKTISVEVVLALIERLFNRVDSDRSARAHKTTEVATYKSIQHMLEFLEPHDLPSSYFDYVESRLVLSDRLDQENTPILMQKWSNRVSTMRDLQRVSSVPLAAQDLQYNSILEHSLFQSGIQHQALTALVHASALHNALAMFNDIQELVDRNKVRSIAEFLQPQQAYEKGFFSSRPEHHVLEYSNSHGQLPYYRLAAFLDLVTESNLSGLGSWLLYSGDLDGSLIPESAYGLTCLAPSLSRFAFKTLDRTLLDRVVAEAQLTNKFRRSKPTVALLRAFFDADVALLNFTSATGRLEDLRTAQGGGFGLSNLAHLAATILRMEGRLLESEYTHIRQALRLLEACLDGTYDLTRGDFTKRQQMLFKQQVAHLVRLFAFCEGSQLQRFAHKHAHRFIGGNQPCLPAKIFNVFFSAYIDTHGFFEARTLWTLFCRESDPVDDDMILDLDDLGPDLEIEAQGVSFGNGLLPSPNKPRVARDPLGSAFNPRSEYDAANLRYGDVLEHTDNLGLDYDNPFFPDDANNNQQQLSDHSLQLPQSLSPVIEVNRGPVHQHISHLEPIPVTKPNLSSLRMIVRTATVLRQEKEARNEVVTAAEIDLQNWARGVFERMGVNQPNIIAQEFLMPLSKLNFELRRQYKTPDRAKEDYKVDTNTLWVPSMYDERTPHPGYKFLDVSAESEMNQDSP